MTRTPRQQETLDRLRHAHGRTRLRDHDAPPAPRTCVMCGRPKPGHADQGHAYVATEATILA